MKKFLILSLAVFMLLTCFGCGKVGDEPTDPVVYAPDLSFTDMNGQTVKLSDFKGKPIVLNFWASWCGPCKSEMPLFQEKYEELGDKVQFLVVALVDGTTETVDTAKAYIAKQGYTFPVYFDEKNQANEIYGVNAIPTSFFIATDGAVLGHGTGALTKQGFEEGIRRILPSATE